MDWIIFVIFITFPFFIVFHPVTTIVHKPAKPAGLPVENHRISAVLEFQTLLNKPVGFSDFWRN